MFVAGIQVHRDANGVILLSLTINLLNLTLRLGIRFLGNVGSHIDPKNVFCSAVFVHPCVPKEFRSREIPTAGLAGADEKPADEGVDFSSRFSHHFGMKMDQGKDGTFV